jgi:nicotinamide-nucleotide amidase
VEITRHGVVSEEIAQAMANGALARSEADLAIAITGYAGPAGPHEEAGLVYIALAARGRPMTVRECHFGPVRREEVRKLTVHRAFEMIAEAVGATA